MTAATIRQRFVRPVRLGLLIAAIIGIATVFFARYQIESERRIDLEDVARRAHALGQQLAPAVERALALPDTQARRQLRTRLEGYRRLLGYAGTGGWWLPARRSPSSPTRSRRRLRPPRPAAASTAR